jgi:hypothetical protein
MEEFMKITKLLLLALCGILCIGIFSCTSSGGGGGGSSGGVFEGNWEWVAEADSNEGGTSTANMVIAEEVINGKTVTTYTFSGEVTGVAEWPWASVYIKPADEETLQKLQSATAVSFKILTEKASEGLFYMQAPTPVVTDYGFHRRNLAAPQGEVTDFTLQFRSFTQPGWAAMKRLNVATIEELQFGVAGANAHEGIGTYKYKVWDFNLQL